MRLPSGSGGGGGGGSGGGSGRSSGGSGGSDRVELAFKENLVVITSDAQEPGRATDGAAAADGAVGGSAVPRGSRLAESADYSGESRRYTAVTPPTCPP